jgi:6-phosphogluconate dehydrogenase
MKLAMIGLGKMGGNMATRLIRGGHQVVGYDRSPDATRQLHAEAGLIPAFSLEDMVAAFDLAKDNRRVIWLMLPAGDPTESVVQSLDKLLSSGDIVVDGGNSNFNDSIRRSVFLKVKGIDFVDVGVSGGVWGLTEGYSLMAGGDPAATGYLRPVFEALAPAPDRGWGVMGPSGSGHYVKMIHNGIEYGIMEAFAEGFELLQARKDFNLDLHQVAEVWRYGSVVRSWLLDLTAIALAENPNLSGIRDWVADSGEGRWTVFEAINNAVPAPVITLALYRRFSSRQDRSYAEKLLAAMRNEFGGHEVKRES